MISEMLCKMNSDIVVVAISSGVSTPVKKCTDPAE